MSSSDSSESDVPTRTVDSGSSSSSSSDEAENTSKHEKSDSEPDVKKESSSSSDSSSESSAVKTKNPTKRSKNPFADEEAESDSEDESSAPKKKKKKVQKKDFDSSDEEDEERMDEEAGDADSEGNIEGLIDDDEGEDEGPRKRRRKKKKKPRSDASDDSLDEGDLDLIRDAGGDIPKYSRVAMDSDSDKEDDKEKVQKDLFADDVESDSSSSSENPQKNKQKDSDSNSDDDEDNFIVDAKNGNRNSALPEEIQEAIDIFGNDFEFQELGDNFTTDEEESDEEYFDRKTREKSSKEKSIFEIYEPDDLQKGYYTEKDKEIRLQDVPERFQTRRIPVQSAGTMEQADAQELQNEARWIINQAFSTQTISKQTDPDQEMNEKREDKSMMLVCQQVLHYMRNHKLEVPLIAHYRKENLIDPELKQKIDAKILELQEQAKHTTVNKEEEVYKELKALFNQRELFKIYNYDEKWLQLKKRKQQLVDKLNKKRKEQEIEIASAPPGQDLPVGIRPITDEDLERIDHAQTMDELIDINDLIRSYFRFANLFKRLLEL